jgi:hypothetical protein
MLSADADIPILPLDFHDLLFLGALVDEYRHLDDTRLGVAERAYTDREKQFKYWMHESTDGVGAMASPSTLGGWFEAGT